MTGEAFEKVRDGELDASFYYGDLEHPDVAAVPLIDFAYRIVGAGGLGRPRPARVVGRDRAMPWIIAATISSLRTLADELFAEHGSSPVIRVEADNEAVHPLAGRVPAAASRSCARTWRWKRRPRAKSRYGTRSARNHAQVRASRQREHDPEIWALLDVLHQIWTSAPAALRESG